MTITRGITTVALTALGFCVAGAGIGYLIGTIFPEFYRIMFRIGDIPDYDGPMFGLAIGMGQGVTTGLLTGMGVVLLVTWYEVRKLGVSDRK